MKTRVVLACLTIAAVVWLSPLGLGQQVADPNFDVKVAKPSYKKDGPKVLFDEAHNNFHTASGRYKPFADLITNDGYRITPGKEKFSAATLKGYDILVISNALGARQMNLPEAANPAFTPEEMERYIDAYRYIDEKRDQTMKVFIDVA